MGRFTSDMLIRDVLVGHPETVAIFERYGLGCASCLAADMETVAAVASMHDVPVDALLSDLNDLSATSVSEEQTS